MSDGTKSATANSSGASDANAENSVSIDGAELEALRAKALVHDRLAEDAEDAGYDNPVEYQEYLETTNYANRQAEKNAAEKTNQEQQGANKEQQKPPPPPAQSKAVDETIERAEAATRNSYRAVIETSFITYDFGQKQLPEAERDGFTREELNKVIGNKARGPIVANLAQDKEFDGNIYAAAAHYLTSTGKASDLRQQGANAEKTRTQSQQGAAGRTGAGTSIENTQDNLTEEEKADKDFMERVVPDTRYKGD